jgi:hypothetical protein
MEMVDAPRVLQVYRDSVADGLGLRTVIFFCRLRPESEMSALPESRSMVGDERKSDADSAAD